MSTELKGGKDGGVIFVVNGVECCISKEDADELRLRLLREDSDTAKQTAHKIHEAQSE